MEKKRKLRLVRKIYFLINWFIRITLLIAIYQSIRNNNYMALFFSLVVFFITFIPYIFNWRFSLKIPTEIQMIIVLFIYSSLYLGEIQSYYTKFWWWDIFLHAGSAIIFGFLGFTILYFMYSKNNIKARPWAIAIFSFSFAIAIGATWEIFEFSVDQLLGYNMQKSGLIDTMGDLIVDALGAILATSIGYIYLKTKKTIVFNTLIKGLVLENKSIFGKGFRKILRKV